MSESPDEDKKVVLLADFVTCQLDYEGEEVGTPLLLRFLRARDFDLEQTRKLLTEYVVFQRTILQNPQRFMKIDPLVFKTIRDTMHEGLCETDNDGRPVHYVFLAKSDLETLVKTLSVQQMLDYMVIRFERLTRIVLPTLSKKYGRPIDKIISVIDMESVSPLFFVSGKPAEFLKSYLHILQNQYPELLEKAFVVNVSFVFRILMAFITPFLNKKTVARLEIIQGNPAKQLKKVIPKENLPEVYGGTCSHNLKESPGPWQPVLQDSEERQTWFWKDLNTEAE